MKYLCVLLLLVSCTKKGPIAKDRSAEIESFLFRQLTANNSILADSLRVLEVTPASKAFVDSLKPLVANVKTLEEANYIIDSFATHTESKGDPIYYVAKFKAYLSDDKEHVLSSYTIVDSGVTKIIPLQ